MATQKATAEERTTPEISTEALPMSPKKFRQSPELEGFYRFIYENDLRREASLIIEKILLIRKARRSKR